MPVAFTLCTSKDKNAFVSPIIINSLVDILVLVVTKNNCIVPVYCFMPNHQHLIIMGTQNNSDIWKTVTSYKQKTGFWLSKNAPDIRWQKDFYDHIIRKKEDLASQVRYILNNPVRKGLVSSWEDYPFKSSIGCDIEEVFAGII